MPANNPIENLGDYLREQRKAARLSLRQLSDLAGVSNPYLSQIERGLKKPSAEILQALAKSLQVSAESLYVKAGFLDERTVSEHRPWDVETSIAADAALTDRQKDTLIDIYRSFVGDSTSETTSTIEAKPAAAPAAPKETKKAAPKKPAARKATTKPTTKKAAAKKPVATNAATTAAPTTPATKNAS